MEAVDPEVYGEAEQRERWVDADLRRIAGDVEEGGGFEWKPHAVGRNRRDQCFVHKAKGDPVWWIKVVGEVFGDEAEVKDEVAKKTNTKEVDDDDEENEENEDEVQPHPLLRNVDNLLDEGLHVRQHEWHQLYVDGRIFERVDDQAELCYFQYASPIFFVSGRDTCYIKMRRDLDDGGFILSYRSIRHDDCPPHKDYVRLEFEGAHMITPLKDSKGFTYTYIQHADAKGRLPKAMANGPQADVMLKEIEGVRKAIRNPLLGRP